MHVPIPHIPSGEEMVEESGVPVQDDWSMAPEDESVRFSLSGVMPHSWGWRAHRAQGGSTCQLAGRDKSPSSGTGSSPVGPACLPLGEGQASLSASSLRHGSCWGQTKTKAQVAQVTQVAQQLGHGDTPGVPRMTNSFHSEGNQDKHSRGLPVDLPPAPMHTHLIPVHPASRQSLGRGVAVLRPCGLLLDSSPTSVLVQAFPLTFPG